MNVHQISMPSTPGSASDQRSVAGSSRSDRDSAAAPRLSFPDPAPLSVQAGLVGLVAASSRAAGDLEELCANTHGHTAPLKTLLDAVRHIVNSTRRLQVLLRRIEGGSLERPERNAFISLDSLIAVLTAAILTISELGNHMEDIALKQTNDWRGDAFSQSTRQLEKDLNRVQMAGYILTNMLCVLSISDETQVEECRKQVQESITDMLQSDVLLAVKLNNLQDVFGAKKLVAVSRLEEIARRPPPKYSVPKTDERPPAYTEADSSLVHADGSVTIPHESWSVFSGLTLADVSATPLLPLPLKHTELRHSHVYAPGFVDFKRRASEELRRRSSGSSRSLQGLLGSWNARRGETSGGFVRQIADRLSPSPR
ncbi:hypothetical protein HIM_01157 [Hirsutella minnesotensis 3608]|nr:hypothetical protein HIM_01157 [Hirsutella minnesotensis 3608]